jgi:hypothetical protein
MYIDELIRDTETWKDTYALIKNREAQMAEAILLRGGDANLAFLTSEALDRMTMEHILNDDKLRRCIKEDVLEGMKLFG